MGIENIVPGIFFIKLGIIRKVLTSIYTFLRLCLLFGVSRFFVLNF